MNGYDRAELVVELEPAMSSRGRHADGVHVDVYEETIEGALAWSMVAPLRMMVVLSGAVRLRQVRGKTRSDDLAFHSRVVVHARGIASSIRWTGTARIAIVELPDAFIERTTAFAEVDFGRSIEVDRDDVVIEGIVGLLDGILRRPRGPQEGQVWKSLSEALVAHLVGASVDTSNPADSSRPDGIALNAVLPIEMARECATLLSSLMDLVPSPGPGQLARWQERLAKTRLSESLSNTPSIAQVASACGISRGHFSKAFKNSTGHSPHQWLVLLRIETAKSQLLHSSWSLADIAAHCGFSDQSHLTRTFVRLWGVAPGRWQRLNRDCPPRANDSFVQRR